MERTYEALLDENNELRKALSSTKEILERSKSDNDSLKRMHEEFKLHHERLKKDSQEANLKCAEAIKSRKEIENYYETYVQKLKTSVDQGKREFEEMQSKMIPPVDTELLRLKLVNEIEGPMKIALDNKEDEISRLQSQIYDLTRKLDLALLQYNSYKTDTEKELRDIKSRYSSETSHLFSEIQSLQEKLEDPSDKDIIRSLKRDKEEQKIKQEKIFEELDDYKKKLEVIKNERNELKSRYNRDVEEEKNKVRLITIERDRLELQNKDFVDQAHKLRLNFDSRQQEVINLKKDLESCSNSLESSELQASQLKQELSELQKRLFEKDTQSETKLRETVKAEKEKFMKDKEDKEKLARQVEELEQKVRELNLAVQAQEREAKHEIDRKKHELSNAKEDLRLVESRNSAISKEVEMYKSGLAAKNEELERYQNDLKGLTLRYNEAIKNNEASAIRIQQLESRADKTGKGGYDDIKGFEEKLKSAESNVQYFKGKAREYKAKVKQGNEKIQELGVKLAKSEIERQKLTGRAPGIEGELNKDKKKYYYLALVSIVS